MPRKQERVRVTGTGQHLDERPRGIAERHCARAGLRAAQVQSVLPDVPPAKIQNFATAASGEGQQPDRGDRFRPAGFVLVERAPEPRQLVSVKEPRDLFPRVFRNAETGVAAALTQSPFLGPEQHCAQYLEGAVGRAGPLAHGGEPVLHVLHRDRVHGHVAENGQDVLAHYVGSASTGHTALRRSAPDRFSFTGPCRVSIPVCRTPAQWAAGASVGNALSKKPLAGEMPW